MPAFGGDEGTASVIPSAEDVSDLSALNRLRSGCGPFDRQDFIRVLAQSLRDLGLTESFQALHRESQVQLEAPVICEFRQAVLHGQWDLAESKLAQAVSDTSVHISAPPPGSFDEENLSFEGSNLHERGVAYIQFHLWEQQYLELLEAGQVPRALRVLRERMAPLAPHSTRLKILSSFVLFSGPAELYERADWDGAGGTSRQILLRKIERVVDTQSMLPSGRLIHLLEQAVAYQRLQDPYYSADSHDARTPSLLSDYTADSDCFPRYNTHVLLGHADEVWTLRFSSSGRFLATAGRDRIVTIWDVDMSFAVRARFVHRDPVSSVDFSSDEKHILVASEEEVTLWDLDMGVGSSYVEHKHTVSSVRFLPSPPNTQLVGRVPKFVSGSMDHFILFWDFDGSIIARSDMSPYRVTSLDVSPCGRYLVAVGWQPFPAKSAKLSEAASQERSERRIPSEDPVMTLLPLSLTDGTFIPYDIRSYSSASRIRTGHLDLLDLPDETTNEPNSRQRLRHFDDNIDDALEGLARNTRATPASVESKEKRSRIFVYDLSKQTELTSLYITDSLNHVSISSDSRFAVLGNTGGDIILFDIETQTLLHRYRGHFSSEFVIRATFGGTGENLAGGLSPPFVISGSEDSRIYAWHRASGRLIEEGCHHKYGAVNDVAWRSHPNTMMASCGDDCTIRIWQSTKQRGEPLHHTADQTPVSPTSRKGTCVNEDRKRPSDSNDVPMDEASNNPGANSEPALELRTATRRRIERGTTRQTSSGRIRNDANSEHQDSVHPPEQPRPHLLPW